MFVVETRNAQETGMITPVVNTVEYPLENKIVTELFFSIYI